MWLEQSERRTVVELWLIFGVGDSLESFDSITLAAELRRNGGSRGQAGDQYGGVNGTRLVTVKLVQSGWILNTCYG